MFDVFGQMWGTMLINGMSVLCTVVGILGVCVSEKAAIGLVGTSTVQLSVCSYSGLLKLCPKVHASDRYSVGQIVLKCVKSQLPYCDK